jgi:hypothetical protein
MFLMMMVGCVEARSECTQRRAFELLRGDKDELESAA